MNSIRLGAVFCFSSVTFIRMFLCMSKSGDCNKVLEILMCRFGGLSSGLSDVEGEENDNVELEKSNVLLMGPTGSGSSKTFVFVVLAE